VIDISADVSLTWAGVTFSSKLVTPIYLNDTVNLVVGLCVCLHLFVDCFCCWFRMHLLELNLVRN
jgi:hypothetical protein